MHKILIHITALLVLASCATMEHDMMHRMAEAHYKIGLAKLNSNEIQGAFVEFNKAIDLNPNDKRYHNVLGLVYLRLEYYDKAEEAFKNAISLDSEFSEAHNNLGVVYAAASKTEKSVEAFKKALANPFYVSSTRAYNNLGKSLYMLGRHEESINSFKESLKRSPEFHLPFYGLALSYNALGRYEYAYQAIAKAIKYDPVYKGDIDRARADWDGKKLMTSGQENNDILDYLDILNY